jgi:hypothetical protein
MALERRNLPLVEKMMQYSAAALQLKFRAKNSVSRQFYNR